MIELTNDPDVIRKVTGFDPWEHSLLPKLSVDGYRSVMPVMATGDGEIPRIFMKEIDRTNVEHLEHQAARFVWYAPYFTFGGLREPSDAWSDLETALRNEVHGPVGLDPAMAVQTYRTIQATLGVGERSGDAFAVPRKHYVVARRDVAAAFEPGRTELKQAAAPLIADLGGSRFEPWLTRVPEDRFEVLDRLLEEAGLEALFVASPLAIQDLTGVPMRAIGDEAWAVYPRGSDVVHLLARVEVPWAGLPLAARAPAALKDVVGTSRVGFEDVALSFTAWTGFGLGELDAEPATELLRRWRELRSWEDVPATVIVSRVTLEAINDALAHVEHELAAGRRVSELDAYERYRSRVESFIRDRGLPITVRTYFTHCHAGDRSHFPASATDHEVTERSSLKIDGGLEVYDSRGMFLGVSDITRSAVGSSRARAFYELLDRALVEGAIASCRPGVKGADVFGAGLSYLEPHRDDIISGGFMPPSDAPLTDLFDRNIGHLIGKQEPATVEFHSSDSGSLEAGMVAAAEIQWPYAGYIIGTEDVFLVTDDGPLNLTRPM
jgi:Xaa-Pro aminopeptidase